MAEKTEKTKLNAYINTLLADKFRQVAKLSYGPIGLCLSAAMLQFLETDAEEQRAFVQRVREAEANGTVDSLIADVKQKHRPSTRDPGTKKK